MAVSKGPTILYFECKSACYVATIVLLCLCICYSFAAEVAEACRFKKILLNQEIDTKSFKCQLSLIFMMLGNLDFIFRSRKKLYFSVADLKKNFSKFSEKCSNC